MWDTILRAFYFAGLIAGGTLRAVHRRRNRQNRIVDERGSAQDWLLASLPSLGMIILPLVDTLSPSLSRADYHLPAWAGAMGVATYGAGLWLLWRSHADLGRNWSMTLGIREEHSLVTGGVYRHIRHPMYAAHWLWAIAQPLLLQNWIAGFATLVTFLPLYLVRVPREEQMMLAQFGEEYRSYTARTGRVIPRLWR